MVSQAEYEGVYSESPGRESAAERENRYLQRRLDQLEAERLGITVEQLEEKRFAEFVERKGPPPETEMGRALRIAAEQAQAHESGILARYGVPEDADGNLKLVLLQLTTDAHSQMLFRSLIAAIAGVDAGESTSLRDIVAWWPSLSPEVGEAIGGLARHYATVYRSMASYRAG